MTRTLNQFGILAPLIPVAFVVTAIRRPRYALLTGTAVAITCFFAASYINADINRYYLGPALIAWTWLAIMAAVAIELLASVGGEQQLDEDLGGAEGRRHHGNRPRLLPVVEGHRRQPGIAEGGVVGVGGDASSARGRRASMEPMQPRRRAGG